jgi:hypothetical protein
MWWLPVVAVAALSVLGVHGEMVHTRIPYTAPDGSFLSGQLVYEDSFLADASSLLPGIVIVPDWDGIYGTNGDFEKFKAERFAEKG